MAIYLLGCIRNVVIESVLATHNVITEHET